MLDGMVLKAEITGKKTSLLQYFLIARIIRIVLIHTEIYNSQSL